MRGARPAISTASGSRFNVDEAYCSALHTTNLHERHASGPQLYELLGRKLSLVCMSLHRHLWCVSRRVCLEAAHTQARLRFVVLWSQFGLDLCSGGLMHVGVHAICLPAGPTACSNWDMVTARAGFESESL